MIISRTENKGNPWKAISVLALSFFFFFCRYPQPLLWCQEKTYPSKPIKIVIPYEPGALIDQSVRVMTEYLNRELGVPMVVENRSGASGLIGANEALRAKPDGYTLLACGDSVMNIAILMSPNPPFDPFKEFIPVCPFGGSPNVFAVHKDSPFKTLADLVKAAKENPGKITAALTTMGGETHLDLERFRKAAGVNIKIVPYRGSGEGVAALLGRHVDMLVLSYLGMLSYVKSGEARLLAVGSPMPGSMTPTFAEAGYPRTTFPRFNVFYVSSKTPEAIREKLVPALKKVATHPEVIKKWEMIGLSIDYKTPAEFIPMMKEKWDALSVLIEDLGLRNK